jgi:hypothetical protein
MIVIVDNYQTPSHTAYIDQIAFISQNDVGRPVDPVPPLDDKLKQEQEFEVTFDTPVRECILASDTAGTDGTTEYFLVDNNNERVAMTEDPWDLLSDSERIKSIRFRNEEDDFVTIQYYYDTGCVVKAALTGGNPGEPTKYINVVIPPFPVGTVVFTDDPETGGYTYSVGVGYNPKSFLEYLVNLIPNYIIPEEYVEDGSSSVLILNLQPTIPIGRTEPTESNPDGSALYTTVDWYIVTEVDGDEVTRVMNTLTFPTNITEGYFYEEVNFIEGFDDVVLDVIREVIEDPQYADIKPPTIDYTGSVDKQGASY